MTLRLVHSRDDLPRAWDGIPVHWGPPEVLHSSHVYHVPLTSLACSDCGSIDERPRAVGRRDGMPLLIVERCPCGRDEVTEMHDDGTTTTWVLDAADYTPAGSWPPAEQGVLL